MTGPRESTLINCSLSKGSLRPFDINLSKATDVARRIGSDVSVSRVMNSGTVAGVTVKLMSIQPEFTSGNDAMQAMDIRAETMN